MNYYSRDEMLKLASDLLELLKEVDPSLGSPAAERLAWEMWSILPSQNDNVRHALFQRGIKMGVEFELRELLDAPLPGDPDWPLSTEKSPPKPAQP